MLLRYYITGHGLGHASRACRIIAALSTRHPGIRCEVVSDAAPWFLADNLPPGVAVAARTLDVGVRQTDSLGMHLEATLAACRQLQAGAPELIAAESADLRQAGVDLVVTDVAALPCAAAAKAGIPAVITSNFTWDWIYEGFVDTHPAFAEVIDWQRSCYQQAHLALRLPFHGPMPSRVKVVDLPLVTRHSATSKEQIRGRLGMATGQHLALLSFGGFGLEHAPLDGLSKLAGWVFLAEAPLVVGNPLLRQLPTEIPYPDLVNAADVVVTKPGYGIVAECLAHRTPLLYTPRGNFREQALLIEGLHRYGRAVEIDNGRLRRGDWRDELKKLFTLPQPLASLQTNGAAVAADHLARLLA